MRPVLWLAFAVLPTLGARPARAESFQSWSAKADKAAKKNDADAAVEAYTNALRLWTKADGAKSKAKALAARAAALEKGGDLEKALADLSAALAADKRNPSYYHRRGKLRMRLEKPSEAADDFYKAVALDFNFKEAYFDRALAYEALGDLKFAREDLKFACSLGHKKACSWKLGRKVERPPAQTPAPPPPPQAPEPAPEEEPPAEAAPPEAAVSAPAALRISTAAPAAAISTPTAAAVLPKPAAPLKPDFAACLAGLDSCLEEEVSFSACVNRAPACGALPEKGCCPRSCRDAFDELLKLDRSEAAAFREVFEPRHPCAQGGAEAPR